MNRPSSTTRSNELTPTAFASLNRSTLDISLAQTVLRDIVDTDDAFLGSLVLFDITEGSAEVGFWIHPGARGHGHAAGALDLAARLASSSGLTALTARTETGNLASQRNLERSGFDLVDEAVGRTPSQDEVTLLHYRRRLTPADRP